MKTDNQYRIPSTAGVREALAEMQAEWGAREAARAARPAQPTIADVMELLQKLMAEVVALRAAS